MATNNIATLGIKVDPRKAIAGANKAKRAITGMGNVAKRVKNQIFSLNGALGALGAGMVLRSALKYTATVEKLGVRLKFLTGSTEDAGKAFKTMLTFAKEAPFTLQEIQNASPSLLTVAENVDELNQLLKITGDIAAVSGLSFETVGQQLQRSFSGGIAAADLFRDTGIKAMLGFQTGVTYTAEQTKNSIVTMWREGTNSMVGATAEVAKTFDGQVSMMGDAWDNLMLTFMKEGVFDETKASVQEITEWLKSPEAIQGAKDLGNAIRDIGLTTKGVIKDFTKLPPWVKESGLVLAIFGGKKAKAGIALLAWFGQTTKALAEDIEDTIAVFKDWVGLESLTDESAIKRQIEKARLEVALFNTELEILDDAWYGGIVKFFANTESNARDANAEVARLEDLLNKINVIKMVVDPSTLLPQLGALPKSTASPTPKADTPKFDVEKFKKDFQVVLDMNSKYVSELDKVGVSMTAQEKLFDKVVNHRLALRKALTDLNISLEIQEELLGNVTDAYLDAVERMEEARIQDIIADIASSMESTITDAIMNISKGVDSLKDMFKGLARIILRQFIEIQVARPAANFLAGLTDALFKAEGGTVTGNKPYIVGEAGAEVFVPNKTGTIIPNDALGSLGGSTSTNNVNISFNITANDTEGFDELLESRRGMIVNLINGAMNDRGTLGVT